MIKYEATKKLGELLKKMNPNQLERFLQSEIGKLCLASVIEYDITQSLNDFRIKTNKFEERFYGNFGI